MGRANYDLPDDKLLRVVRLAGARSKRQAILIALDDYLKRKQAEKLVDAYGKVSLKWTRRSLRRYRG